MIEDFSTTTTYLEMEEEKKAHPIEAKRSKPIFKDNANISISFKSGWSRLERVLFLLSLLLIVCVLTLCSVIILFVYGDIKFTRISTPPSATSKPTAAMTTIPEIQTSDTMSFTRHEKTKSTSVRPENMTTKLEVSTTATMTTSSPETLKICESRGCVVAAARVLQLMNMTVEPCEDFYQFACGSWIQSHPVEPQEKNSIFAEDAKDGKHRLEELLSARSGPDEIEAVLKTKKAYESCMSETSINTKSIANVDYLIKVAGGMPLVDHNWTMSQSLEDFLIGLTRNFGVMPLLPVTVKIDEKNTSRYLIHIGSGGQVSSDDIVSPEPYSAHLSDPLYDQLATQILKQFQLTRKTVDKQIGQMGTFQQSFGAVKWQTRVNVDNLAESYHPTTLGELQANYTTFDWKHFLEGLVSVNGHNITLPQNEPLILISPSYIARMMDLMNKTRKGTIVNYSILSTIMHYKDPLGIDGRSLYSAKEDEKVSRVRYGMENDRNSYCVNVFKECCGHVLGWMYIRKYFHDDQANKMKMITQMTESLKKSVKGVLESTPWLGPKSKKYGLSKIKDLLEIIGYNNETMVEKNVNLLFDGLRITRSNYFRNIIQITARVMEMELSRLGMKTSRASTDGDGLFAVNAWYDSHLNMITIPAGIIRGPFFDIQSPMALNFGSLGTIVGHELMHAYDDDGSLYDSKGNFFPWLSSEDKKKFNKFSEGLVKQYSNFKIPDTDLYVNGNLTLGENIADNGGVKVTYKAYVTWEEMTKQSSYRLPGLNLDPHQLFFLSFAQTWCSNSSPGAYENQIVYDPHAPDVARVLLTLQNSKDFSSVYGCKKGSNMNPAKKYGVW